MRRYRNTASIPDSDREKLDFVFGVFGPGMKEATRASNAFCAAYNASHARPIRGGCGSIARVDPNYLDIALVKDEAKLPDVIGGVGFGEFLGTEFVNRYVRAGEFQNFEYPASASPLFEGIDLVDATGSYHIYGGSAFTMLVDKRKLDGNPMPRRWSDILDTRYRDQVVMGFNIDDLNEIPLIYLYARFGEEGLRAFADNLAAPIDTLDIMRTSLRQRNTHAIYLVPHFFACAAPKEEYLEEVWPLDGALLSPYYLLAKNIRSEATEAIIDFLLGRTFAQVMAGRKMLHVYAPLDEEMLGKRLQWVGWDWLSAHPIIPTMQRIDGIVVPRVLDKHPELERDMGHALWYG